MPVALLVALFLTSTIASVAGAGYGPGATIIIHTGTPTVTPIPGAPALVGTLLTGLLRLTYANGHPVLLTTTTTTLRLCGTGGCVNVPATIISTGLGSYSYSFNIPSAITGNVQIILPAGSLTDSYGNRFPAVNTVIGTFTVPSTTPTSIPPSGSAVSPSVMQTAYPTEQTTQPQITLLVPAVLALLTVLGVALVMLPNRKP